jgi:hypothetical protein
MSVIYPMLSSHPEADLLLDRVYGDHVHQNPGTHLDGGITNDVMWQDYWSSCLVVCPSQTYDAPNGAVGHRYIERWQSC